MTTRINHQNPTNDAIILSHIKSHPSTLVISVWEPKITNFDILHKLGLIYYTKTIYLTKKSIFNLMYYMYDDLSHIYKVRMIPHKLNDIQKNTPNKSSKKFKITFIIFDNITNSAIIGKRAPIKKQTSSILEKSI